jgi:uncharacterized protein YciI
LNQPEPALADLSWPELAARIARAQLYVLETEASLPDGVRREHLAYLHTLDLAGRLFGWGPIETADATQELAIVAAASQKDAAAIAAHDPLVLAGLGTTRVRSHTMNEGVACYVGRAISKRAEAAGRPFEPDVADVALSLRELEERRAGVAVQAVFLDPIAKPYPREDARTRDAHFVWLRENEMAARLLNCGPLAPKEPLAPGVWGGGLAVFATSRAETEAIAVAEPSGVAGYRSLTVRSWTLDYGLAAPIAASLLRLAEPGETRRW